MWKVYSAQPTIQHSKINTPVPNLLEFPRNNTDLEIESCNITISLKNLENFYIYKCKPKLINLLNEVDFQLNNIFYWEFDLQ